MSSGAASDPTERFGNRVADYVRYRPGYPPALIGHLQAREWLPPQAVVADVGAGTGLSSALFLDQGCTVYAVEPNGPMRDAAMRLLHGHHGFHAVAGRAEATTLPDGHVDLVAAGTAFHWFDPSPTRTEFARILRATGVVALFWNLRSREPAFMRDYEAVLMAHCAGYAEADASRRADDESIRAFFGTGFLESASFPNAQHLDFDSLLGRVLSSSYAPKPGDAAFAPLEAALRRLFDENEVGGRVTLTYHTRLHTGRMH